MPGLKAWAKSLGGISYPLLSDFSPHGEVALRYGVLRAEGFTERAIFVVDKASVVRYRDIHDINEQPDNEEVFKVLRRLEPEAAREWSAAASTREATRPTGRKRAKTPVERRSAVPGQPAITIYCTPWCEDCGVAKEYLQQLGLNYTEIDISKDRAAEKRVRELASGQVVTPTFDIDGAILLDFDRPQLDRILRQKKR